jgi:DnaJ-class molecular chaperone
MRNEGERIMQTKEKVIIYQICEECHGNGFTKCNRLADKDIYTTFVCNACGGSGHSGKHYA